MRYGCIKRGKLKKKDLMFVTWLKVADLWCFNNSFEFLRILIWLIPLLEEAVSQYFWRSCLIRVSSFVRRIDRGFLEHLDEPRMNLCLYGFLCIFEIQYIYGKSSLSSLVSIPNEVRTDLWLSSTSGAEKSVRLYVGLPGNDGQIQPSIQDWFYEMPEYCRGGISIIL